MTSQIRRCGSSIPANIAEGCGRLGIANCIAFCRLLAGGTESQCWIKHRAQQIFDKIRKYSSAPEVEIIFSSTNFSLTRFANNTIHQNVSEINEAASIRVAFDGKTARATTNRFDDEGLKRAVQSAESIARVQEPDPDFLPLANANEGKGAEGPPRWSDQTAAIRRATALKAWEKLWQWQKRTIL